MQSVLLLSPEQKQQHFSAFVDSFIQSVLNREELIDGELQATG